MTPDTLEKTEPAAGTDAALAAEIADFYSRYAEAINDDDLESWPGFFTEDCLYKLTPRANFDRGLPIAIMLSESRGGLADRVTAIRNTIVFAPRWVNLSIGNPRILSRTGNLLTTRANFVMYHTQSDGNSMLLLVGRSFDRIERTAAGPRFVERVVVYDTELLPATIIYPV